MLKTSFLALALLPSACFAETVLCVGEAGTAVEDSGPGGGIRAMMYDVSNARFVISDVSGSWQLRKVGEDQSLLACDGPYFCEIKGGFSSFFMRSSRDNVFTYVATVAYEPDFRRSAILTVKGRCSSL